MHISQLGVTAPALNGWSRPRCCGKRGGESQRGALALALTCSVLSAPPRPPCWPPLSLAQAKSCRGTMTVTPSRDNKVIA